MGRIVKQVSETTTRYYWYPGERREWLRALHALGVGLGSFAVLWLVTRDLLAAVVVGTSAAAVVTGLNFGRRDARALDGFPKLGDKAARRAAVGHTGKAAWRALAHGFGGAGAAVLILNLPADGLWADWLLPVLPTVAGALAHQAGMLGHRLGVSVSAVGPAKQDVLAAGS